MPNPKPEGTLGAVFPISRSNDEGVTRGLVEVVEEITAAGTELTVEASSLVFRIRGLEKLDAVLVGILDTGGI